MLAQELGGMSKGEDITLNCKGQKAMANHERPFPERTQHIKGDGYSKNSGLKKILNKDKNNLRYH